MADSFTSPESLLARRAGLDALLTAHQDLWRPAPFHVPRPTWCAAHPDYAAHLLGLADGAVEDLAGDNGALIALARGFIPALEPLADLIVLPRLDARLAAEVAHRDRSVPGRKLAQVEAFVGGVGPLVAPALEWCAGKGHLGRR